MYEKRCFAILIKHEAGVMLRLATEETATLIKAFGGAAVLDGYDHMKYIACIVFDQKNERDTFARNMKRRGFDFDVRDDAII